MRTNVAVAKAPPKARTHEGGKAEVQRPEVELERAVLACMLFENTFYESGKEVAGRIADLVKKVAPQRVYALAEKARSVYQLRHVPLWLLVQVAKIQGPKPGLAGSIAAVIQRPDEMGEFLSLYWKEGRVPLAAQVKKGLARAFGRVSGHQLGKWNRDSEVKLRDVMFLSHPKPRDEAQTAVFKQVVDDSLPVPDTWEVALSSGADKKATWERLLAEKRLGVMAFLMNLRNMEYAGVTRGLISTTLREIDKSRAFPYRFLTAAKHAPWLAQDLSDAMIERAGMLPKLRGETYVIIDVSGSMYDRLSAKGDAARLDAATSVAVCMREASEAVRVFTFSQNVAEVPNHRGLPLAEAAILSQSHGGTYLGASLSLIHRDRPKP